MKEKVCKACGIKYIPDRQFQVVCDYNCGIAYGRDQARKAAKKKADKDNREAKERIKPRSKWLGDAQGAVNSYVRYRDKDLPCISCGRHHQGQYHAGHYRSVGSAPELRFETLQIHKQCAPCNNHLSGNLIPYRINLIAKVGREVVDWIEGAHEAKKYTIDEIKAIKAEYMTKLKELKKAN